MQLRFTILAVLACARTAAANPLSVANFDGLRGDPVYTGGFSLYWNPAALAAPGWDIALDAQLIARQASYYRDPVTNKVPANEVAANSGLATIGTVGAVPGIAGRWGRALGPVDVGFGLGVFVDEGGSGNWDKNYRAPTQYPGAIDGPQRWSSISSQLLMPDIALGFAVRHRRTGLSIGFTPMLVVGSFATVRARNIDQSEDLVDSSGNPKEGRAYFSGKGNGFSAIVGIRWDIKPGWAVAATYQRGAHLKLEGDLTVAFGTLAPASERAYLNLPIADTIRLGGELRVNRWLSLRPMLELVLWSILQQHVFSSAADNTPLLIIPRRSDNVYGAFLRADARLSSRWKLLLGIGGEKGPTPSSTMDPGFGENSHVELGLGALAALSHRVDLSATFNYQYYLPFVVDDSVQQPTTNGTYKDQREFLIVDLEIHSWR